MKQFRNKMLTYIKLRSYELMVTLQSLQIYSNTKALCCLNSKLLKVYRKLFFLVCLLPPPPVFLHGILFLASSTSSPTLSCCLPCSLFGNSDIYTERQHDNLK